MLFHLSDEIATHRFGARLAPLLRAGDLLALHGGLGAGKTTMTRGLITALLVEQTEVPSPTYTLVQIYDGPDFPIFHYDLYRLEAPEDLIEIGWDETQASLALVEWPEHAGERLPRWRLDVRLSPDGSGRKVELEAHGEDWQKRLHDFDF